MHAEQEKLIVGLSEAAGHGELEQTQTLQHCHPSPELFILALLAERQTGYFRSTPAAVRAGWVRA